MEQTQEYGLDGQLKATYGDCFIRGNNVLHISSQTKRKWSAQEMLSLVLMRKKKHLFLGPVKIEMCLHKGIWIHYGIFGLELFLLSSVGINTKSSTASYRTQFSSLSRSKRLGQMSEEFMGREPYLNSIQNYDFPIRGYNHTRSMQILYVFNTAKTIFFNEPNHQVIRFFIKTIQTRLPSWNVVVVVIVGVVVGFVCSCCRALLLLLLLD